MYSLPFLSSLFNVLQFQNLESSYLWPMIDDNIKVCTVVNIKDQTLVGADQIRQSFCFLRIVESKSGRVCR